MAFIKSSFSGKTDYSNTDKSSWQVRTNLSHRNAALKYRNCNTRDQQKEIEKHNGVRYSVLLELPYFDPPRMSTIDPMHNLLLGTSKHMMEIWKKLELLNHEKFDLIQQRISGFVIQGKSGRQPTFNKIQAGFSGFTAEHCKSWTLYYSLFCLKGILPRQHYQCWQIYVKACYLICR